MSQQTAQPVAATAHANAAWSLQQQQQLAAQLAAQQAQLTQQLEHTQKLAAQLAASQAALLSMQNSAGAARPGGQAPSQAPSQPSFPWS